MAGRDAELHVGFDDTDSARGMCTTYLAYVIASALQESPRPAVFADYPRLVRLNPNIPWKTRGNGAVSMVVRTPDPGRARRMIRDIVFEHADVTNGANPGLAFWERDAGSDAALPRELREFAGLALWQLVSRPDARRLAARLGMECHHVGNGQGLVGAMGAIGYGWRDHTLELLSYRDAGMCGTRRSISSEDVRRMHERTEQAGTFNSYDHKKKRALIAPRGPDPVLYGIRGESPDVLVDASRMVQGGNSEKPAGYMIFRTNQGTGAHLENRLTRSTIKPFASGWVQGVVSKTPVQGRGGHVYFEIDTGPKRDYGDSGGAPDDLRVTCAAYKPTGLGRVARLLIAGDAVRVGGGVRRASRWRGRVLNLEYVRVLSLARDTYLANPECGRCGKRMKSKGAGQPYECVRCRGSRGASKVAHQRTRTLDAMLYVPDAHAQRHLTRPLKRQGVCNHVMSFDDGAPWLRVYKR